MSDIAKCVGNNCLIKEDCWRYMAPADSHMQSYGNFKCIDGKCDYFWRRVNRPIIKWNNGNLAILCVKCGSIVKVGSEFNEDELKYSKGDSGIELEKYYCDKCK